MKKNGFTLIELLIVIGIAAVLTKIAIPSFTTYMTKQRLIGAAETMYSTLQKARTEAIKRNATVFVSYNTGSNWCYGLNTGSACNCTNPASCNLGAVTGDTQLTLSTTLPSNRVTFESKHGATGVSGYALLTSGGVTAGVKVSILGNMYVCSNQLINGYPTCG